MTLQRRTLNLLLAATLAVAGASAFDAQAQGRKDSVMLGMVLEPTPGLDPTTAAAAAIGEVVHYNILEGLTKINVDGTVTPLLADSWSIEPDGKSYTFKLKQGHQVPGRRGLRRRGREVQLRARQGRGLDQQGQEGGVRQHLQHRHARRAHGDPGAEQRRRDDPLPPGREHGRDPEPEERRDHRDQAGRHRPLQLRRLAEGPVDHAEQVARLPQRRARSRSSKVTFRFINDPAAQVAALLAGDIDGMPRFGALQSLKQFQGDKRFTVEIGDTAGKGIVAINNKKKPLDDVRVRRAIMHAIDRKAFIDGVLEGLGKPIGSHFAPTDAGYVDLTKVYPYDPEKAKALLKEAGVATPLNLTLTLPPPQYARKGGEVIAAQLAKVGIVAKIENVEWAQWLSGPFKGNFDLTIINHVEPLDYMQYANTGYYWGYDSKAFRDLAAKHAAAGSVRERSEAWAATAEEAGRRRGQRLHLQPGAGGGGARRA